MIIEYYNGNDLTLEHALEIAPTEFIPAYEWFMSHENTLGPRPYGNNAPAEATIPWAAQRGIHKPHGFNNVVSITSAAVGLYQADKLSKLDDDTWVFQYCQHQKNEGSINVGSSVYNKAMLNNMRQGLPVGVFVKEKDTYRCYGLAFIEKFEQLDKNGETVGIFTLRGPVRKDSADKFLPITTNRARGIEIVDVPFDIDDVISTEDERKRRTATVVQRQGQGRFRDMVLEAYDHSCAISDYNVDQALQAAHICSYLGEKSNYVTNGLLLRADLHILYDRSLMAINPSDMSVSFSEEIADSRYAIELENKKLRLPKDKRMRPSEARLAAHYDEFLGRQKLLESV